MDQVRNNNFFLWLKQPIKKVVSTGMQMVKTNDNFWVTIIQKNLVTSDSKYNHFFWVVVTGQLLQCNAWKSKEEAYLKSQNTACIVDRTKYRDSGIEIPEEWMPPVNSRNTTEGKLYNSGLLREQITETERIEMRQSKLLKTDKSQQGIMLYKVTGNQLTSLPEED